jgi:hypothetical protein
MEEGSLGYDGELVHLQVQTNFDTTINRQQKENIEMICSIYGKIEEWKSKEPDEDSCLEHLMDVGFETHEILAYLT